MNCQRLFNLLCVYGNVLKVKFLRSKNNTAMVQVCSFSMKLTQLSSSSLEILKLSIVAVNYSQARASSKTCSHLLLQSSSILLTLPPLFLTWTTDLLLSPTSRAQEIIDLPLKRWRLWIERRNQTNHSITTTLRWNSLKTTFKKSATMKIWTSFR